LTTVRLEARRRLDMADSTLYHDDATPPTRLKGHGTAALGPSDSSDSGSDIQGGPGLNRDDGLAEPAGNTSDPDIDAAGTTAGADIGDANLDSDSDRFGTGERAAAGRDSTLPTDRVLRDVDTDQPIDPESIGDEVDPDLASRDELVGSGVDSEDVASGREGANAPDASSYRPVQAGQDVDRQPASGTGRDVAERDHARADGRHYDGGDDIPVFDRAGREDLPRRHGRGRNVSSER
jgi:hypothetical protein